jgi:hypothetical protein
MEERDTLFMREQPTQTLADVRKALNVKTETLAVNDKSEIAIDLVKRHVIKFPKVKAEVPATTEGIAALGNYLDIPSPFLKRLDDDLQQHLLTQLIERSTEFQVAVQVTEDGIYAVRKPSLKEIDPRKLVDITAKIIDPKAPVVEWWKQNDDFRMDVIVPEGFDRGIGGDKKVGDITRGGLRITQDLKGKHNYAPSVQSYTYRLWCTNGAEHEDAGLKIDARGGTVEQVLAEFELIADRAFRQVESSIKGLYDLREKKVENPERTLVRVLHERRMPDRVVAQLAERVPMVTAKDGSATMFDIVNLITNAANDPKIRRQESTRRALERTGGSIVSEHVARCTHCQSKLN